MNTHMQAKLGNFTWSTGWIAFPPELGTGGKLTVRLNHTPSRTSIDQAFDAATPQEATPQAAMWLLAAMVDREKEIEAEAVEEPRIITLD
jgi:hypothetical protein